MARKWTTTAKITNKITEFARSWYYWAKGYVPFYYKPHDKKVEYIPRSEIQSQIKELESLESPNDFNRIKSKQVKKSLINQIKVCQ